MQINAITELTPPLQAERSAGLTPASGEGQSSQAGGAGSPGGVTFGDVFGQAIDNANRADAFASHKVDALAQGFGDDLHGTMIAVKEADISVRLVATVRNKLLDAFSEIWKTSV
jgi:flagellar hook-basal body complex protein FliE